MINNKKTTAKRFLVIATPPTPNGDLHVGHLSGPYLGADIYCRYLAMCGTEHYYISGVDDHQSYVSLKAEQLGWSPAQVADYFGDAMETTLEAAEIQLDIYARPRKSMYHIPVVQQFFKRLYSEGKLVVKETLSLFCRVCNRHLFEAYVSGKCPHCEHPSGGNACEDCGRPNDCADLIDPVCKSCGSVPYKVPLKRLYFPLSEYEQQLRQYHKSLKMAPHVRALCEQMLAERLPDIAVTHVTDWGIPVPATGFENQRLYVWFEMAPGYLAATCELNAKLQTPPDWTSYWKSKDAAIVQFFGFDNSYFFAVLFPALFLAGDPKIQLPQTFVTNEFYRLNGLKFSTSRNHAIWGQELLRQASSDAVRFYLAHTGPEREQCNFTLQDFYQTVQCELIEGWEAWLQGLGQKVSRGCNARVPLAWQLEEDHENFAGALRSLISQAEAAYQPETFSPQQATRTCCELVRLARRFGKSEDHWSFVRGRHVRWKTSVALELLAAKVLMMLAAPLVPSFAVKGWRALGYETPLSGARWNEILEPLPVGQALSGLATLSFDLLGKNVQMSQAAV
ncbi:MAG TPA: class I tRNA ligase family protein [Terriglobales bacterium]|jgi:methionyl-tRNA synthetase|nr:class I tRNA ligase family protein [Terriglobales bacterium]